MRTTTIHRGSTKHTITQDGLIAIVHALQYFKVVFKIEPSECSTRTLHYSNTIHSTLLLNPMGGSLHSSIISMYAELCNWHICSALIGEIPFM